MWGPDDLYIPPGMIDRQIEELTKDENKGKRLMVGVGYAGEQALGSGRSRRPSIPLKYHTDMPGSPLMPIFPMMSKQHLLDIGSIDERFDAVFYDLDLTMRHYTLGGDLVQLPNFVTYEYMIHEDSLVHRNRQDRAFLDSLWDGYSKEEQRKLPVVGYKQDYFENKYTEHKEYNPKMFVDFFSHNTIK